MSSVITANMESSSGEIISTRNKAIIYALCKRLSIDPSKFLMENTRSCDILSLLSSIFQSSASKNQDEVMKWATYANNLPKETDSCLVDLKGLNEALSQKAVLLGGLRPSEADVVVFSALHGFVSHLANEMVQKYANVIRWLDYIQNKEDFGGALDWIVINKPEFEYFFSVDKIDTNLTAKKITQASKDVDKMEGSTDTQKGLSEKKETSDGKASVDSDKVYKGANNTALELNKKSTDVKLPPLEKESTEKETECAITILKLQVGLIRKAWKHPSADSLLVEEIDLGDGNLRQVVSGLAKYCSSDDLTNRRVVLITNVKPGKLRDVMSSGLVLCASNQDHTVVEPILPPDGAQIGERVIFSGFEGKPDDILNPKKKQLEKITPHLYTDDKGVATYKGIPFMTSAGPCTSSICNAGIK